MRYESSYRIMGDNLGGGGGKQRAAGSYILYQISVPVFQGGPLNHAGPEEANWDNSLPVKDSNTRI
jgi:hypothetical protein